MKFKAINFDCPSCGAFMLFSPIEGELKCDFCATQIPIEDRDEEIKKYDYLQEISKTNSQNIASEDREINCNRCGAGFVTKPHIISSNCPYCGTPNITDLIEDPKCESILPFIIQQDEAKKRLEKWIGSLWFAPSVFVKYFKSKEQLRGYYLPYWGYDNDTTTEYSGMRGDIYYVTVTKNIIRDGKSEQVQVQESRVNWTPTSGRVSVRFDDVLVGASQRLPRGIIDSLSPWNLSGLKHFDQRYLSGFEAEEYTTPLDRGFDLAKSQMSSTINYHIRRDIGGDQQQIHTTNTDYYNIEYRDMLFPIWTASFKWRDKVYRYAINAQTGKISGERPYSIAKIVFAIAIVLMILAAAIYYDQNYR